MIKKIIFRLKHNVKNFGFLNALKQEFCPKISKKHYDLFVLKYLKKQVGEVIKRYQNTDPVLSPAENIIWFFWAQGEECMPVLVRRCYESVKRNAGNYKVILISEQTISHYVQMPELVNYKKEKCLIGFAHYSDILRLLLLKAYGGIWLDATIYVSSKIDNDINNYQFYTSSPLKRAKESISKGKWTTYFLASNCKNSFLINCIYEMLITYWKKNDAAIDYLLFDYIIHLAYISNSKIKDIIDNVPENNVNIKFLSNNINERFDKSLWDKIAKDTFLHKLSYKKKIIDDANTFYNCLVTRSDN